MTPLEVIRSNRQLTYTFYALPHVIKWQIIEEMKIEVNKNQTEQDQWIEFFTKVYKANRLPELREKIRKYE